MCRPTASGGRRCPSHSDPVMVANRNARRREQYHQKKNTPAKKAHSFFSKPFSNDFEQFASEILYNSTNRVDKNEQLNISSRTYSGHLVNMGYFAEKEISGVINYSNLNENSYKEFGFAEPQKRDSLPADATRTLSINELEEHTNEQIRGLSFFSTDEYQWMNNALYRIDPIFENDREEPFYFEEWDGEEETEPGQQTAELLKKVTHAIDSALENTPHAPRIVYRGMNKDNLAYNGLPAEEWVEEHFGLGKEMIFDGYQSTSLDYVTAMDFAGDKGIIYEILTPEGANISSISDWTNEEEVLLPRKARYMCVGLHKDITLERTKNIIGPSNYNVTVVQLVAIDENGAVLNSQNHHKVAALSNDDLEISD